MDAKKLKHSSSSQSPPQNENQPIIPNAPRQAYACRFCPMSFSSAMALGGHQNAHKSIRASTKMAETPVPDFCAYCAPWRTMALTKMASEQTESMVITRDFLGVLSSDPEASGGRANVEDDAPELDLDLKL